MGSNIKLVRVPATSCRVIACINKKLAVAKAYMWKLKDLYPALDHLILAMHQPIYLSA